MSLEMVALLRSMFWGLMIPLPVLLLKISPVLWLLGSQIQVSELITRHLYLQVRQVLEV